MKTNYHTHTYRCGHATGNEREMVEEAIQQNFVIFGMSCHIPLPSYGQHAIKGFPSIRKFKDLKKAISCIKQGGPNIRMPYNQIEEHLQQIALLKEEYKNQITILQGFEACYLPDYLAYYHNLLETNRVDYLILGNHFDTICVDSNYYGRRLSDKKIQRYASQVVEAMESNLFSYIAHPDLYMNRTPIFNEACKQAAMDICHASVATNTPLEINGGGLRRGKSIIGIDERFPYPHDDFWKIASEIGVTAILGIDAHSCQQLNETDYLELVAYAKKFNITIIDTLPLKKGKSTTQY